MAKIVLVSCVSTKLSYKAKAKDLYISPLFKYTFGYGKSLNPDKIFILSAKYGLVNLDDEIEPYEKALSKMAKLDREKWAEKVLAQLNGVVDFKNDRFIFLAGERYRENLIPHMTNYEIPLKGLGFGRQLEFLKKSLAQKNDCEEIHELFNNMKMHTFPFNESEISLNGIYILFEKGEFAHGKNRIVRVGTHTGNDNLRSRLKEHFINENKDRSIFRKNIGRCLLKDDVFLKDWELTPLIREVRINNPQIDFDKQKEIEKEVSKIIRENFSFIIIPIRDKDKRLKIESRIISTISLCDKCKPSKKWLGLSSPKEKIRQSGLWLVNELYKEPLSQEDMLKIRELVKNKDL